MENIEKQKPNFKLYSKAAIGIAGFFGGPLGVGYILAQNFKSLGRKEVYKKTILLSILATALLFIVISFLPDSGKWQNYVFPIVTILTAFKIFEVYQKEEFDQFKLEGGEDKSNWKAFLAGIVALCIIMFIAIGSFLVVDLFTSGTKSYGVNTIEYKLELEEVEVDLMAEKLSELNFFDNEIESYVYLDKEEEMYILSIAILEEYKDNEEVVLYYQQLQNELEALLFGKQVMICLIIDDLEKPFKVITSNEPPVLSSL